MTYPTVAQVEEEAKLLSEWASLAHGYSKSFRDLWASMNLPDRLVWLRELVEEARIEARFRSEEANLYAKGNE